MVITFKVRSTAYMSALAMGLLLLLGSLARPMTGQAAPAGSGGGDHPLRVLAAAEDGLLLELITPAYQITPVTGPDARPYVKLAVPGFVSAGLPGQPDLPAQSVLVAVPPGAHWVLETEILAETTAVLRAPVWPAPDYVAEDAGASGGPTAGAPWPAVVTTRFTLDAAAYATDTSIPASFVRIEEAGYVRDVRLAHVTVAPLLYRAAAQELRVIQHARIRVRFVGGGPGRCAFTAAGCWRLPGAG